MATRRVRPDCSSPAQIRVSTDTAQEHEQASSLPWPSTGRSEREHYTYCPGPRRLQAADPRPVRHVRLPARPSRQDPQHQLHAASERGTDRLLLGLRVGEPDEERLGAWLAKESVRDIYLTNDPDEASLLIDKAIAGCAEDDVEEIRSLGRTLASWRTSILEHHNTG